MIENNVMEVYKNIEIFNILEDIKQKAQRRQIVFLCVGNSKVWYDSFGPIFGSLLKLLDLNYYIYGNTKSNITSSNIREYVDMIYRFHINPYIIVIDNAISYTDKPILKIKEGSIICAVTSDNQTCVGDYSITYCLSREDINDCNNYFMMLKEIKRITRMLAYVFSR